MVFAIVGGDGKPTGYDIDNSLRFNDGGTYLTRAQANGNQDKWTWSGWVKRSTLGAAQCFFATTDGSATSFDAKFDANDNLDVYNYLGGGFGARLITNREFRDTSAWYHIVIVYDSGNGTEAQRLRIYVNGTEETSFSTTNYPSQNEDSDLNVSGSNFEIGRQANGSQFFDGYMSEVFLLDGQAKVPTDFAETNDNGVWIPKDCKGNLTFGTNGLYLKFQQTGTSANSSGMGADTSGNDNHLTLTNFAAKDVVTDTPTNNFATLNPLAGNSQLTANGYFFGNTRVNANVVGVGNSNYLMSISNIGVTSGKWYAEFKPTGNLYSSGTDSSSLIGVGSGIYKAGDGNHNTAIGGFTHWWLDHDDDRVIVDGNVGNTNMNSGTHVAANDIIGVYLNCDTTMPTVTFHKNGAALGGATNSPYNVRRTGSYNLGTNSPIFFMPVVRYGDGSNWGRFECNFGNPPSLPSSGNTDANGYGNFEYSPTLGGVEYYALCTKNLAEYG